MKPSHKSKGKRNGNHSRNVLWNTGGSEKCVIFIVRFGYKCRWNVGKNWIEEGI